MLLFSISYGCSIAGVATPSGGARNAIIISYWKDFFYNPSDPATYRYLMDYVTWIIYAFPMFLLRLPLVAALLTRPARPDRWRCGNAGRGWTYPPLWRPPAIALRR